MELSTAEQRLAKAFGDGIRNRRKKLGYTQEKLASMIGSNRRFISELESGKGTSYLAPSLAAAEALGLNISTLFEQAARPSNTKLPPL
ncbi:MULTISPECIES: helix-turn-helix domain-containing protein [Roseobacteraceae]|uniref:helix-turn-helix domain-containing protein n=1 Tax=Roseobacteraceae TaxID=2854170 RepID=UPI000C9B3B6B|nr:MULTISPECIES: helix-turn-helix domain-containing protein [Roseobacteraceae]AUQ74082.1 anaerobic benzoate catabolism transcriptional regulator [Phaeobacter piscinae]MBO9400841.1 helix-turn-helix transcriptional regulator [Shimia sp. R9_3]